MGNPPSRYRLPLFGDKVGRTSGAVPIKFGPYPYGFRGCRSTADLLTVITDKIYKALNGCGEARTVALDISKAFDRVWHAGLLHKLPSYGISGRVFNIIASFLTGRRFQVILDSQHSETYQVRSGVPQGSILGPVLFLIFINDISDNLNSSLGIYADDTTLYSSLNHKSQNSQRLDLTKNLENDLTLITDWGKKWLVTFNSTKTKLLSINRFKSCTNHPLIMSGNVIPKCNNFRLLGLEFNADLTWNDYIKTISKKAAMKVGSLFPAQKIFITWLHSTFVQVSHPAMHGVLLSYLGWCLSSIAFPP